MPNRLFIPALFVLAGLSYAQTPVRPEFEVASVKINTSGVPNVRIFAAPGNPRFTGGNGVIDAGRYDIEAKAAEAKAAQEQIRLMLQALLADRFKLAVHCETKEVPIYALTPGKGETKLAEPKGGSCVQFDPASPPKARAPGLRGGKISMEQFVEGLSNILGRPVIDKTGYTGTFDAALESSQEGVDMASLLPGVPFTVGKPPDDDSRPSIFTALQDQLGLILESQKGPAALLVIDHAEKASEN